jgi:glycine cleavage system transcriptional repressor
MVAGLTHLVYSLKGNIDDASMTRLGGEFGMMLVVGLSNSAGGSLVRSLAQMEKKLGLSLTAKPLSAALAQSKKRRPATHLISVYGTDRPGIVYRVTELLARQRINITDLNTQVLKQKGKLLYVMLIEVDIASHAKAAALERRLARMGSTLHLDVTLQDIRSVPL